MPIVILDDKLYCDIEYAKSVVALLRKYFNLKLAVYYPVNGLENKPFYRNMSALMGLDLLRKGNIVKLLDDVPDSEDVDMLSFGFSKSFSGKLHRLHDEYDIVIVPVSDEYHKKDVKLISDFVHVINNVFSEIESNIACYLSEGTWLHSGAPVPTVDSPLPNTDICSGYKELQDMLCSGVTRQEKIATYRNVAKEVLMRNRYVYSKKVSSLNNGSAIRDIYVCDITETVYASVDVEKGAVEVFDRKGCHKGEYAYSNTVIKDADKNKRHDICVR